MAAIVLIMVGKRKVAPKKMEINLAVFMVNIPHQIVSTAC